ncbi:MAG: hypothetical protein LBJ60_07295 [Tannerellaceae bacterium]|jgi:hypothetical protein|nr:hypothetical protein [Tannerellaceae bacterium]
MDKQKIAVVAEKVKSFAIALVGVVFFSWGTNYLAGERLLYNVPHILIPVFNLFGAIGLAIGLLVLGGGVMVYAFLNWKKVGGKPFVYWAPVMAALVVGVVLANTNFKSSDDFMKEQEVRNETQLNEIRNSGKPDFKNQDLEKHLASFNDLCRHYEEALQADNKEAIAKYEDEFNAWCIKIADFTPLLNADEQYDLSRYYAKLVLIWHDLRQQNVIEEVIEE